MSEKHGGPTTLIRTPCRRADVSLADNLRSYAAWLEIERLQREDGSGEAYLDDIWEDLRIAADLLDPAPSRRASEPLVSNSTLVPPRGVSEFRCEFCGEDYPWHHNECHYVTELARIEVAVTELVKCRCGVLLRPKTECGLCGAMSRGRR